MDYYLLNLLNQYALRWEVLDGAAVFFAEWSGYVMVAVFLIFLALKKWPLVNKFRVFVAVFLSAAIARLGFTVLIRTLYYQPRPYLAHIVNLLINKDNEASFPSGHAAFFFAFSAAVFYYNKKLGIVFFVVSVLMGLARIFSGIHYPADVAAGAIVGLFSAWLVRRFNVFR